MSEVTEQRKFQSTHTSLILCGCLNPLLVASAAFFPSIAQSMNVPNVGRVLSEDRSPSPLVSSPL